MGPQVLDEYFSRHKNGVVERLHLIILRTELSHFVLEEVVKKEYVKYKKIRRKPVWCAKYNQVCYTVM
jgi:hypothetical protein